MVEIEVDGLQIANCIILDLTALLTYIDSSPQFAEDDCVGRRYIHICDSKSIQEQTGELIGMLCRFCSQEIKECKDGSKYEVNIR